MHVFQLSKASFSEEKTFPFLRIFWKSGCHSKGRQDRKFHAPHLVYGDPGEVLLALFRKTGSPG